MIADPLEDARSAIRDRGFKVNPYRMGREMGRSYAAAFVAWRDEAKASRDYTKPRPNPPECPYTNRHSISQFAAGVKQELPR